MTLTGELALPGKSGRAPLVILLHGCDGLGREVKSGLRAHARALNRAGFATLILDSFKPRRIAGGWVCDRNNRLSSAVWYRQSDVKDAIKFLKTNSAIDAANVALVGQSNGAGVAVVLAGRGRLKAIKAAVAYYPWCGYVRNRSARPLLVLTGEADDWTPPEDCKKSHNPNSGTTVHVYPGATHSFDLDIPEVVYKGHRLKGDRKATSDSRRKMISFFRQHLRP
ncbi:MAG: dienelactone hydrolase family protein [Pseudomonadota bacterium]